MPLDVSSVVVPVDFSDLSLAALARAARDFTTADLHVVHVLPAMYSGTPELSFGLTDDLQRRDGTRAALADEIARRGLAERVRIHILGPYVGNPASEVARLAEEVGTELIVVPSHGRTGLQRLALGSVAEVLVRLAHCPVLVLRT